MGKEVIGYKVVRRVIRSDVAALLSAAVRSPDWSVVYTPGYPSYGRQGTPLFAFDSLPNATRFRDRNYNGDRMEIWQARLARPRRGSQLFEILVGTLACDAVTLLERV